MAASAVGADSYAQLLADFPAVVNSSKQLPRKPSGDVEHHIVTRGPPLACRFRRLDGEKLAAAKKEFLQMEKDGIVRRSNSPWSSPLHMVRKPDGSWRPCGDYRRLNLVTVPDSYPLPNMLDFSERIAGCTIFSKVDLRKGYHQILMHPGDIEKTAIATPFGLFEFLRMTFGLRNAGNTFQRQMDRLLSGLDFVFVYLDDIIIGSRSAAEHMRHLRTLFQRLQAAGLVINQEKCVFGVAEVEFLGHHVTAAGVSPIASRVSAIQQHPAPTTVKELQGFLGGHQFLPAVHSRRRPHPEAADRPVEGRSQAGGGHPLDSRHAGGVFSGKSGPGWLCPAHPPHPRSGGGLARGRLSGPHRRGPPAAAPPGGAVAAPGIFLQEAGRRPGQILRV